MTDHDDARWECPPHTKAKHQMLAKYLDAWYPIIASWNGRLIFLDGFAGRGRYTDGSEGSPLTALRRLLDHQHWPRMRHREFVFIFVERDRQNAESLRAEIDAFTSQRQPWPDNVKIRVVHATFDKSAAEILESLRAQKANLAPTFAFIDPFGYSGMPMDLLGELMGYRRTELFVNFMVGHVQRFIARDGQQRVMRELFGMDVEEILRDLPSDANRIDYLRSVYERQLREVVGFNHVQSFAMVNETGNVSYYLIHGTPNREGVKKMKYAMWSIDPGGGYRFSDRSAGMDVLFEASPDLRPLQIAMLEKFKGRTRIPISDIEWFAVLETPYRETHVRSVLRPLENQDVITVHRPGRHGFPEGTTIDFS